jgi:hypothetical protein
MNGLGVMGDGAIVAFSGAAPMNFNGTLDKHIRLIDSSRDISATQVMFFGLTAAEMTPSQFGLEVNCGISQRFARADHRLRLGGIKVTVLNDLTGDGRRSTMLHCRTDRLPLTG